MSDRTSTARSASESTHPGVEAGVLLGRVGVEIAADRLDGRRDLLGRAPAGALEQQVLQEVRGAGEPGGLVAGADGNEEPDAERAAARHLLGDQPQAAGQRVAPDLTGHQRWPGDPASSSRHVDPFAP